MDNMGKEGGLQQFMEVTDQRTADEDLTWPASMTVPVNSHQNTYRMTK